MNARALHILAIFLACAGIVVAGFLSYAHMTGATVPCGMSGGGCATIQNHPSSVWFGVPVAYLGFGGYIAILATLIAGLITSGTRSLLKAAFVMATIGAVVSLGLQAYAAAVIKATCDWCLGSAGIMCAIFVVLALLLQRSGSEAIEKLPKIGKELAIVGLFVIGSAVSLGLIAGSNRPKAGTIIGTDRLASSNPLDELTEGAPSRGPKDAPVTIVEFADLYCGSCRVSFAKMEKLQAEYPGKIRWVFRHFPLFNKQGHELALPTAVVAEYASKQGKFWEFVEQIFSMNEDTLKSIEDVYRVAQNVNVDVSRAALAIDNPESGELLRVTQDINLANKIGIAETPTFILLTEGERPIALRSRDLDAKIGTAPIQALLKP